MKSLPWVLLVLSLVANMYLAYLVIDGAKWLDDMKRGRGWDKENVADMHRVTERYGRFPGRGDLEREMKQLFPGEFDVVTWEGDSLLWANEIGFVFRGDSVARVVLMNGVN